MALATITNGSYRGADVAGTFPLVRDWKEGVKGGFVTVEMDGSVCRVKVDKKDLVVNYSADSDSENIITGQIDYEKAVRESETEEQALNRIARSFEILQIMTRGSVDGSVRGVVVSGPPGIGKSYGVEETLREANVFFRMSHGSEVTDPDMYSVIKGACTPIALYQKLFENRYKGRVTVFDDCDVILQDDLSLNLLKAALDSSKRRFISWNAESRVLKEADIPDTFEFSGSVIFLTNLSFDKVRSAKLRPHLDALKSRCLYLDLDINNQEDMLRRIRQIVRDGMLAEFDFEGNAEAEIVKFVEDNANDLRELSLRTVLKVASLYKTSKHEWKELAIATILRPEAKWRHFAEH